MTATIEFSNGVRFNEKLYKEYRRKAGIKKKEGIFSVTDFPNGMYCFPLQKWLGINGKIDDHPFIGKKILNEKGEEYTVSGVNVHFMHGYYYVAVIEKNRSHGTVFFENINSNSPFVKESVNEFEKKYTIL